MNYDEMEAGRELDALVADKVMNATPRFDYVISDSRFKADM